MSQNRFNKYTKNELEQKLNTFIDDAIIKEKQRFEPSSIVNVETMAQHFNVDPATLRRWTQKHFGVNPLKYICEYRIAIAKSLLLQGTRPAIVSEQLAYSEHKVFSTQFKRSVGVPPSRYTQYHINSLQGSSTAN